MVIRNIVITALIAAAICIPIVVLTHKRLMPSQTELAQLDALVEKTAPPSSTVRRLASPDRVEAEGNVKTGYFTYVINGPNGARKVHVDWRIEQGQVRLVSIKDQAH